MEIRWGEVVARGHWHLEIANGGAIDSEIGQESNEERRYGERIHISLQDDSKPLLWARNDDSVLNIDQQCDVAAAHRFTS
jgi:hypothetical protein